MEAVDSLIREGFAPSRDIYFAFGHDEETGGAEGAAKIAADFEKRGLRFEMVIDEGGYITEEHFGRKRFPAALIGVGEKGCSYYRMTATGKAGHSSMPPKHSAVGVLAEAICRIETAQPKARLLDVVDENMRLSAPAMRFIHRFTVCNLPFSRPLLFRAFSTMPAVNPMFRTTVVCTQLWGSDTPNILSGQASCIINARILQGDTPKSIRKYLQSLVDDLSVEIEPILEIPASKVASIESETYKKLCRIIDEKYPGLIKDIYIGKGNYNQELYPQALLLEFGTDEIEKDKAIGATKYMASVLNQALYGASAKASGGAKSASAFAGIGWVVGLAVLAAVVYALISTGKLGPAWEKLKRGTSEITGGLFGKKPDGKD